MDEVNKSQYESDSYDGSKIDDEENYFQPKKTFFLMKRITERRMELFKIGNGKLSQMIWKFLMYQIIMMGPIG